MSYTITTPEGGLLTRVDGTPVECESLDAANRIAATLNAEKTGPDAEFVAAAFAAFSTAGRCRTFAEAVTRARADLAQAA
jgi:hypothetical protein